MKNIIISILLVTFVLAFSACSNHQFVGVMKQMDNEVRMAAHNYDEVSLIYKGVSGNKDVHVKYLFQENAEYTLYRGAKYFRIVKPMDSSSEMLTTPKEFHERCFDHSVAANFIGGDYCVYIKKHSAMNNIKFYKEKPSEFLVFDAQEVIDYLKQEGLYLDTSDFFKSVEAKYSRGISSDFNYK